MNSEQWLKVKEIFHQAVELKPPERHPFLLKRCEGDAQLLRELELLMESHDAAEQFIEQPALASASDILSGESYYRPGLVIGQYRVLSEMGRGGMGLVLLGVRADNQFNKRVAIKVLRRGMDTEDIMRRFHNERQILASLEHPYIARLLDGGMTADGLPYFVMEYIEGEPLDKYCDKHRLSINERLELFRKVCSAVQYAHQNLVIHRDLKPSNILITSEGEPKLLDFGIAKLLNPNLSSQTIQQTATFMRLMTPEYASPEQIRGRNITTVSDVYSLGILLYRLLTGHSPYRFTESSLQEIEHLVCESEPEKPSTAISRVEEFATAEGITKITPETVGEARHEQPEALRRRLRGDLDNIVLKALRKEPERRYSSVTQLSDDVRRYAEGLPVMARKDTFAYRASKFVRRNRLAVTAASLIFLTLIGGIITTAWQARKANEQAALANAKSAEAQAALQKTEKINRFMQSIFSYANPDWYGRAGGRRDMSVLEAMRDIEKHIDEDFRDEPDLRSDVYQQIGDAYRTQELYEDAERNLRKALQLRLELYGEDNAKVAESMYILSGVRMHQGDLKEQERLLTKALSIQRRHPLEGNDLPYMLVDYAALLQSTKNDYAGALPLAQEALEIFRRRYGESHYMVGQTQAALVLLYNQVGDYAQAEAMAREHLNEWQSPDAGLLCSYAATQICEGDYQGAENTLRQLLARAQTPGMFTKLMPRIYNIQSFMAYRRGDYAQALAYAEKVDATQPSYVDDFRYSRAFYSAMSLNKLGQAKRAELLMLEEIERLKHSERVLSLAILKSVLGESLTYEGRFAEAETFLLEAYEAQRPRVLPKQYDLLETRRRLAELYRAWGKADEAQKYE